MSTGKTAAAKASTPAAAKDTENDELAKLREQVAQAEEAKKEAEAKAKEAEKKAEEAVKAKADAEKANEKLIADADKAKAKEAAEDEKEVEAVVNKKVKLFTVQFIEEHTMYHNKKSTTFAKGANAEVDQHVANKLFQRKIAVVIR